MLKYTIRNNTGAAVDIPGLGRFTPGIDIQISDKQIAEFEMVNGTKLAASKFPVTCPLTVHVTSDEE